MTADLEKSEEISRPLVEEKSREYHESSYSSTLPRTDRAIGPDVAEPSGDALLTRFCDGRAPILDVTRITCVFLVALDHGAPEYSHWNTLFTQNWGLQFIFLTCGVSFGFSKTGLGGYTMRLAMYFLCGVACNWTAWVISGQDWMRDPWNVVFQMWFVVGVIFYSLLLAPLRYAAGIQLKHARTAEDPTTQDILVGTMLLVLGVIISSSMSLLARMILFNGEAPTPEAASDPSTLTGFGYWFNRANGRQNIMSIVNSLALSFRAMWVVLITASWFPQWQSCLGWFLMLHMYGCRMLFWYPAPGDRLCHGLDIMLLGLTCYLFGLYKKERLADLAQRYWFVIVISLGVIWRPGTEGRFDSKPPEDLELRTRCQMIELIFMAWWLVAGERWVDHKIFTEDRLAFMGDWALLIFMVHKALHIILPNPFNWIAIASLVPVCWFLRRILIEKKEA
mmetsp:Transcript_13478/g.31693  ORF Transcript_13478/g.31693 Transcript_13478/m.31693 type:complete len:450 (+) Transcript_13478:111-1460(+)|eukprot:CAMPEP_0178417852 /NCGR_PEP_ID=MMETSP0689_2-20121128/24785_1 /TAXON_ID=160604 /ORGANISM="Amphidinium massartii, Strain CS-259" /LENGTH=449 /DNA_ID=CAMNT_0020039225 /DNA_START=23 /DNA_END=1372 /DNA_ORIENTATION=+